MRTGVNGDLFPGGIGVGRRDIRDNGGLGDDSPEDLVSVLLARIFLRPNPGDCLIFSLIISISSSSTLSFFFNTCLFSRLTGFTNDVTLGGDRLFRGGSFLRLGTLIADKMDNEEENHTKLTSCALKFIIYSSTQVSLDTRSALLLFLK